MDKPSAILYFLLGIGEAVVFVAGALVIFAIVDAGCRWFRRAFPLPTDTPAVIPAVPVTFSPETQAALDAMDAEVKKILALRTE